MAKIVILGSYSKSFILFRKNLLETFLAKENIVIASAAENDAKISEKLNQLGVDYIPILLHRTGISPIADIIYFIRLISFLKKTKPDILLSYTSKPVIYGSIAAWLVGVKKRYSIITGLGYSFTGSSFKQRMLNKLLRIMYRFALSKNTNVFFQNPDDRNLFDEMNIITNNGRTSVTNGSGIDLESFKYRPVGRIDTISFLLIARLLSDKGIYEYAEAAKVIKRKYPGVSFRLIGWFDNNPAAIPEERVHDWHDEGIIEFLGYRDDITRYLEECSVYVLPSYREGTPRTVLEAMALGRAVITTDAPGCRETVVVRGRDGEGTERRRDGETESGRESAWMHGCLNAWGDKEEQSKITKGENGFLVPVKDVGALVEAMERFIRYPELIPEMGKRSRKIAEEKFDVRKVNEIILREMGIF